MIQFSRNRLIEQFAMTQSQSQNNAMQIKTELNSQSISIAIVSWSTSSRFPLVFAHLIWHPSTAECVTRESYHSKSKISYDCVVHHLRTFLCSSYFISLLFSSRFAVSALNLLHRPTTFFLTKLLRDLNKNPTTQPKYFSLALCQRSLHSKLHYYYGQKWTTNDGGGGA